MKEHDQSSPMSEYEEFAKFAYDFSSESDRAAVILGAAKLDTLLLRPLLGPDAAEELIYTRDAAEAISAVNAGGAACARPSTTTGARCSSMPITPTPISTWPWSSRASAIWPGPGATGSGIWS